MATTLALTAGILLWTVSRRVSGRYRALDDRRGAVLYDALWITGACAVLGGSYQVMTPGCIITGYVGGGPHHLWLLAALIAFWHVYKLAMVVTASEDPSRTTTAALGRFAAALPPA